MNNDLHSSLWQHYESAASNAISQGNLGKAGRILKDAFRESEEYGEINDNLVSLTYDLAEHYLNQYRYIDAENSIRMVLEVREKLLGLSHPDVIESLKKVAIVQILAFRAETLGRPGHQAPVRWNDGTIAFAS